MPDEKMYWFILELETGFIDGWYSFHEDVNEDQLVKEQAKILAHWDKERPYYTHTIAMRIDDGTKEFYLPDNRCLNQARGRN